MNDVYKTPEADLVTPNQGGDDIDNFKRFSAWGVFGLSIITLGIYGIYWLFSRTARLHEFYHHKISDVIIYGTITTYVISFIGQFVPEENLNEGLGIVILISSLANVIFLLVWVFTFRSRLHEIARDNGDHNFSVGPILTFFFQSLYLQYKINQYIDEKHGNV